MSIHPGTANPHLPDEGLGVPEDAQQQPGQTPPAESGVSCLDGPEHEPLSRGWGRMPIIIIMVVVALFVLGTLGRAIELML
ncbi:DUF6480 family protein [Streptomyces sp. NPDC006733]|uniref:DUF6480 family protein n=1 Tax=Streptomyces sp. NPDC006733 TaxID=3155460 RepID=UPI0034034E0E